MHAAQMHEYQTLVKQYAVDGQCPNCCRFYHHRLRLCAHFRTADDCLQRVRAAFPPLTDHELAPLSHADQDHTRDMRAQGEVLQPPDRCFVLLALLYLPLILRRLLQCWRNGNYAKGLLLLIVFEALWGFATGLGLKCRRLVILRVTLTSSATFASSCTRCTALNMVTMGAFPCMAWHDSMHDSMHNSMSRRFASTTSIPAFAAGRLAAPDRQPHHPRAFSSILPE